jgi:ribonuclease HI
MPGIKINPYKKKFGPDVLEHLVGAQQILFEGKSPSTWVVVYKTLGALDKSPSVIKKQSLRLSPIIRINGYALDFFDGASVAGGSNCGTGGAIKCSESPDYRWYFNCGAGTNTKAELLGAWASLIIAKHLDLHYIQILGDSKVIIDWLKQKGNLQAINIEGWKCKNRDLVSSFRGIYFQHIFRESNEEADKLSKQALSTTKGRISTTLGTER